MNLNKYPLRTILWESTSKCNANCDFCGSKCTNQSSNDELSTHEILTAFESIAQKFDATKVMINVTGGEPLLRDDLIHVMKEARSLGFNWGLVTNGTLLTENVVKNLKDAGMSTISISIDGLSDTHNRIRKVNKGFEKIINGINILNSYNFVETIMITTVVSKINITELSALKNLFQTLPIDVWRICPVDEIGRAEEENNILLSLDEFEYLMGFISDTRKESLPFKVTTSCSHYLGKYEFLTRDLPFSCQAGKTICSILSNGDIFVCPNVQRKPELIQGNVRKDDLLFIWENGFLPFRKQNRTFNDNCKKCEAYSLCQGDSLHTWDFETNSPKFCAKKFGLISNRSVEADENCYENIIGKIKNEYGCLICVYIAAQSMSKDHIIVSPKVSKKLFDYFKWGIQKESVEQICALYGRIYRNMKHKDECFLVVIDDIMPINDIMSTKRKLFIDTSTINLAMNSSREDNIFLGFIHSHPNEQSIAMSYGDYSLHRTLFEKDWHMALSIIINPQKKYIAAYAGPAANHVKLELLFEENDYES